jgi:hypothetical protein
VRTSFQVEPDVGVFLLLVAVVVRPAFYNLHIAQLYVCARCLWGYEAAERNYCCDGEGYGCEEAEDILQPHESRVHDCCGFKLSDLCGRTTRSKCRKVYGGISKWHANWRAGGLAVLTRIWSTRGGRSSALWKSALIKGLGTSRSITHVRSSSQ